jgi:hypothetical protein
MKKITFLLFSFFAITFNSHAQFPEDFDAGATLPTGWISFIGPNGLGTTENWQINDGATNNVAFVTWEAVTGGNAEDWLVTPQFTVDATNFILSFDQSDSFATDYGSTYTIRVSTASQTTHADFTIVDTQTETDVWSGGPLAQHTVDLTAYIGTPIYIAFVLEQNDGDRWIIDNVDMIANASAPNPVVTPNPIDMAMDIAIDETNTNSVAFAWNPAPMGDSATAYDVYLGDSPSTLNLLGTLGTTSVNVTGMDYSTLYYWQVVAKNVGGDAVGSSTWSFTTEADPTLSVDEFIAKSFSVFPNPVSTMLNINTNEAINALDVYNQLGQHVITLQDKQIANNSVDVSNLSQGIYFITITAKDKKQTIKFVKE